MVCYGERPMKNPVAWAVAPFLSFMATAGIASSAAAAGASPAEIAPPAPVPSATPLPEKPSPEVPYTAATTVSAGGEAPTGEPMRVLRATPSATGGPGDPASV